MFAAPSAWDQRQDRLNLRGAGLTVSVMLPMIFHLYDTYFQVK